MKNVNLIPNVPILSEPIEPVYYYLACVRALDIPKQVEDKMWDHLSRYHCDNGRLEIIGEDDINRFINEGDLEVAQAFYQLVANCVGTDEEGELNEFEAQFLISW